MARPAAVKKVVDNAERETKPVASNQLKLRLDNLKTFQPLTENQKSFFDANLEVVSLFCFAVAPSLLPRTISKLRSIAFQLFPEPSTGSTTSRQRKFCLMLIRIPSTLRFPLHPSLVDLLIFATPWSLTDCSFAEE